MIGWFLLNKSWGHSGKHLDSAAQPQLLSWRKQSWGFCKFLMCTILKGEWRHWKPVLTSSTCWSYKHGIPEPHTRESQKLFIGQQLDCTPMLSESRICQTFEVMTFPNGLWQCGWFWFTLLPNLSCYLPGCSSFWLVGSTYIVPWFGTLVSVFLVS